MRLFDSIRQLDVIKAWQHDYEPGQPFVEALTLVICLCLDALRL